ncbi:MAG: cyclic nucleotide-binding domain-containing protein, partial [Mariprofundaceae bacterium]
ASIRQPSDEKKETMVAHISSGDEIGEISVISGRPRAATVTAITPLRLMTINMESVDAWRRRYSDFGYALHAQVQGKMQRALEAMRPFDGEKPSETTAP